ncbi:MAG: hypothetical protein LH609_20875 [Rudanella sp.]|nr:hypothetical protein [Rudanella sp.]
MQPSTESWSRLQGRLAGQPPVVEDKPSRRIGTIWYGSASAVAACLLLAFLWTNWSEKLANTNAENELSVGKKSAKGTTQPLNKQAVSSPLSKPNEVFEAVVTQPKTTDSRKNELKPEEQHSEYARQSKVEKSKGISNASPQNQIVKATEKQPEPTLSKPDVSVKNELASATSQNSTATPASPNPERTLIVSVAEPVSEQPVIETKEAQPQRKAVTETPVKNARIARIFRQIKRLKDGEALAKADVNTNEADEESGLVNRLFQSAQSKENQRKQQK